MKTCVVSARSRGAIQPLEKCAKKIPTLGTNPKKSSKGFHILLGVLLALMPAAQVRAQFIGWACGGMDGQTGLLVCTTNGVDWFRQGVGQLGTTPLGSVAAVNGRHVWVTGDLEGGYASIYYSSNAGQTWTRQGNASSLPHQPLHKIWAVDQNVLWMVGVGGSVVVTDNGGVDWHDVSVAGYTNMLQGVTAVDQHKAWVSGEKNPDTGLAGLFYTENGGQDWLALANGIPPQTDHLLGLAALDDNRVFAIGGYETILATTNAGAQWESLVGGGLMDGNEICVLDENRIWAANDAHVIWTTNAGASWNSYHTREYTMDVSTPDGTNVWALSHGHWGGIIYYSPDGGASWIEQAESNAWMRLGTVEVQRKPVSRTLHVDAASGTAVPPYDSWATAASNIQDAVDAALDGDIVLVTNGVYSAGGRTTLEGLTNRVAIDKPVMVKSMNGPEVAMIVGRGPNSDAAVRGVYMVEGASLIGFTVTNGATLARLGADCAGGGIFAQGGGAVISNCMVTGNTAWKWGGGVYGGTLYHSVLSGNEGDLGGGAFSSTLYNCLLTGNRAWVDGGGASGGALFNCTLVGNSANSLGGGVWDAELHNCIVYYNDAPSGANWSNGLLRFSCTTPLPEGVGNMNAEPGFLDPGSGVGTNHVAGDYRLQSNSPCVNAGLNDDWMHEAADLDGNDRIQNAVVDIGAVESAWWGMFADVDADGFTDWTEVEVTGTDPTNASSFLGMMDGSVEAVGMVIRWQSVEGLLYHVDRSLNLMASPAFQPLTSNITGQPGTTTVTDTTATAQSPYFYRVVVRK